MSPNSLDFSQRTELAPYATVIGSVLAEIGPAPALIVGALARDLVIHHAHQIPWQRETQDIDLALALPDWHAFTEMKHRLVASGGFRDVPARLHRIQHLESGWPVDLVPFGEVETAERCLSWPPDGSSVMNAFGFREALCAAWKVHLPGGIDTAVASPAALALLKIMAWQDRHLAFPKKDALDLMLVASHYLDLGHLERLWREFPSWATAPDFDYALAGARMLGIDMSALLASPSSVQRVATILAEQSSLQAPGLLPQEMQPHDADLARNLLRHMLEGLLEGHSAAPILNP